MDIFVHKAGLPERHSFLFPGVYIHQTTYFFAADATDLEFAGTLGMGQQEPTREPNEIVEY